MTPTFAHAGRDWLAALPTTIRRNGRPLSGNTQRIYAGNLARLTQYLGWERLPITNKILRDYVAWMRKERYSASQIAGDVVVAKLVCESIRNENGDCLYPLKMNHEYIATPIVNPDEQDAPVATRVDVERAMAVPELTGIVAMAAGAGLRVSEILALRAGDDGASDVWSPEGAAIHIRRTLKTPSAARTVYLCDELNAWLGLHVDAAPGSPMFSVSRAEVYRLLTRSKLLPCHSYRRFYATHRDEMAMNDQVLRSLMGHKKKSDTTNRYKGTAERIDFVRSEVERVGLGFTLPATVTAETMPELATA
jgi:integrase